MLFSFVNRSPTQLLAAPKDPSDETFMTLADDEGPETQSVDAPSGVTSLHVVCSRSREASDQSESSLPCFTPSATNPEVTILVTDDTGYIRGWRVGAYLKKMNIPVLDE